MQCTHCKYPDSSVVYTRHDGDNLIRRRRECNKCGMRFTTQEKLKEPRVIGEPTPNDNTPKVLHR